MAIHFQCFLSAFSRLLSASGTSKWIMENVITWKSCIEIFLAVAHQGTVSLHNRSLQNGTDNDNLPRIVPLDAAMNYFVHSTFNSDLKLIELSVKRCCDQKKIVVIVVGSFTLFASRLRRNIIQNSIGSLICSVISLIMTMKHNLKQEKCDKLWRFRIQVHTFSLFMRLRQAEKRHFYWLIKLWKLDQPQNESIKEISRQKLQTSHIIVRHEWQCGMKIKSFYLNKSWAQSVSLCCATASVFVFAGLTF